jgi:hypothetical protein
MQNHKNGFMMVRVSSKFQNTENITLRIFLQMALAVQLWNFELESP